MVEIESAVQPAFSLAVVEIVDAGVQQSPTECGEGTGREGLGCQGAKNVGITQRRNRALEQIGISIRSDSKKTQGRRKRASLTRLPCRHSRQ